MHKLLVASALLTACGPSKWSKLDTAAQLTLTASLAADYAQTRAALNAGWYEDNVIMGERGETIPPELYFAVCAWGSFVLARELPRPWRTIFQGGVTVWQADTIRYNWEQGWGL